MNGYEIFLLGQDGAIQLAVRGELRDAAGKWLTDGTVYVAKVAASVPMISEFGDVTAIVTPAELAKFLEVVRPMADYEQLRTPSVSSLYGNKAMAVPALLSHLMSAEQLGLTRAVLVPQELATGYLLVKLGGLAGGTPDGGVKSVSPDGGARD